jgi:triacylglycerol lipase
MVFSAQSSWSPAAHMNGGLVLHLNRHGNSEELYTSWTTSTGCANATSSLECLWGLPFKEINAALDVTDTWVSGTGLGPCVSVIDEDFLHDYESAQIAQGRFVKIPILYGTNTDEDTTIGPSSINTDQEFRATIAQGGPDNEIVSIIEYPYHNVPASGIPAEHALTVEEEATHGLQFKRASLFFLFFFRRYGGAYAASRSCISLCEEQNHRV